MWKLHSWQLSFFRSNFSAVTSYHQGAEQRPAIGNCRMDLKVSTQLHIWHKFELGINLFQAELYSSSPILHFEGLEREAGWTLSLGCPVAQTRHADSFKAKRENHKTKDSIHHRSDIALKSCQMRYKNSERRLSMI